MTNKHAQVPSGDVRPRAVQAAVLLGELFWISTAQAQTTPALLLNPWPENHRLQASASGFFLDRGRTEDADRRLQLRIYQSQGHWRPDPSAADPWTVGYDLFYLDFLTSDPAVPPRLVDQSLAVGFHLGRIDDWNVDLIAGLGYAGNNPFADADALYGKANLGFSYTLHQQAQLRLSLDYNGNRSIFPDVPLPGIAYTISIDSTCLLTVGAPFNSVQWKPADRWVLYFQYVLIHNFEARVEFELAKEWSVFAAVRSLYQGFTRDGDQEHRRLFFQQRVVEAGLHWRPVPSIQLLAAGGYAFDQQLERGFDSRNTHEVVQISDEPYFRGSVTLEF